MESNIRKHHTYLRPKYYPIIRDIISNNNLSTDEKEELFSKIVLRVQNKTMTSPLFKGVISNIATWELNKYRRLMDKNFGLSEIEFNKMIVQLKNGDEKIFETIFLSHFKDCISFVQYKYKAAYDEAYDASMQAMLSFCQRLKEGKITYGNLRFLFTQMAGQYHLKNIKKTTNQEAFSPLLHDRAELLGAFDDEDVALLDKAWNHLGDKCKSLLKEFYYNSNTLNEIAEQWNKNAAAIRKQKQRCVEKLRELFIDIS